MNKLQVAKNVLTRTAGSKLLTLQRVSPEIFIGLGAVGLFATGVLSYKATIKMEGVIDEAQKKIKAIKRKPLSKKYTEFDVQKDIAAVYLQTSLKVLKLYGPSVALGFASIYSILNGRGMLKARNLALVAAYKAIDGSFKDYRRRVVNELGVDKDREFKTGVHQKTITRIQKDENGKTIKIKETVTQLDPNKFSSYARFFEESNTNWSKTPEYNMIFLKCQQSYANDLLVARGHVFLNEVYDLLGVPRSQAGAVVGWILGDDNDNYVDFGLYNMEYEGARNFINGYERSILLDFNVDGVIHDKI